MEKLKYDGVIFDLDGVIVDTAKYHFLAWQRLAKEIDISFTKEDNERLKGVSRMRCMDIILEIGNTKMDEKRKVELTTRKNEWYLEYVNKMDESEILKGAVELIDELKNLNLKVAIGSASKNAKKILKKVGLFDKFDFISDGTIVSKAKPDPEVFIIAADKLEVDYNRCIVFEDSEAGIEAANRMDMLSVGIGEESNLKDADVIFKGVNEFDINLLYI